MRRDELPRYKGGMLCHHFQQHGFCFNFNKYGSCSLNHPRALHKLVVEPARCPQCSLVWPCHHCSFSLQRDALLSTVLRLETRFHLLTQIAVEAPPIALTSHLVLQLLACLLPCSAALPPTSCVYYSLSLPHLSCVVLRGRPKTSPTTPGSCSACASK